MMLIIVGLTSPFVESLDNKMELINEVSVFLITYHLYLFTDYMPEIGAR